MGLFFSGSFVSHSSAIVDSSFPPSEHFVNTRLLVLVLVCVVLEDDNNDNVWGQWLTIKLQQGLETLEIEEDEQCFVVVYNGDIQIADILKILFGWVGALQYLIFQDER